MIALITGASSGMGRDMAKILSRQGHELILVARNEKNLNDLKNELKTPCEVIVSDLSEPEAACKLYEKVKNKGIDILINNAGYGLFGKFTSIKLEDELNMIDLNVRAIHILTKLFLSDFVKRDSGYILNVSSIAGLMSGGPFMSTYYATKTYVLRLTESIYEELRHMKSNVKISALCPGPVDTNFNSRAGVMFSLKSLASSDVAEYALRKLFKGKLIIMPGLDVKIAVFGKRFVSEKLMLKITYDMQKSKGQID